MGEQVAVEGPAKKGEKNKGGSVNINNNNNNNNNNSVYNSTVIRTNFSKNGCVL